mmetsp:Transcript_4784/g.7765  ORF Transcript_4784/g.7765 Transcript_4784/m.7765 type:complete len:103 (+) Transcript_4784:193-501(+)
MLRARARTRIPINCLQSYHLIEGERIQTRKKIITICCSLRARAASSLLPVVALLLLLRIDSPLCTSFHRENKWLKRLSPLLMEGKQSVRMLPDGGAEGDGAS